MSIFIEIGLITKAKMKQNQNKIRYIDNKFGYRIQNTVFLGLAMLVKERFLQILFIILYILLIYII